MGLRSFLRGGLLLRLIGRELTGIRLQLQRQGDLLERLANQVAPLPPPVEPAAVAETGVSFLDPLESGLVLDYIAKTERDTGRAPTEEEILTFLADERTVDLHARLRQREREIADRPRRGEGL